jgi:flagellar hook-length control protein FliK
LVDMPADVAGQNNAMPMHEFLKQVQSGEPLVKMPVLMMQAPTFVEDMTQFVIKSFTMDVRAEGITEAKLSLYPQHLGQVDVKLTMHNGQLIAQFVAESSVGREMLESQLSQLRTTLQSQGIQVDKLEVTQSQSFQSGLFQEQRQQSQQSNKQQKSNGTSKVVSLDEELAQETEKTSQVSNGAGLTSIDTTA